MEAQFRPVHIRVGAGSQLTHLAEVVHQLHADQLDVRLQEKQELLQKNLSSLSKVKYDLEFDIVKAKIFCLVNLCYISAHPNLYISG